MFETNEQIILPERNKNDNQTNIIVDEINIKKFTS